MTTTTTTTSKHETEYEEAEELFDEGKLDESVKRAKDNLANKTLPPFYVIKNCVLIASALDNWDDANVWRLAAEQTYLKTVEEAKRKKDKETQALMEDIRNELDELADFRLEEISGLSREDLHKIVGGDDSGIGMKILEQALEELEIEENNKGK